MAMVHAQPLPPWSTSAERTQPALRLHHCQESLRLEAVKRLLPWPIFSFLLMPRPLRPIRLVILPALRSELWRCSVAGAAQAFRVMRSNMTTGDSRGEAYCSPSSVWHSPNCSMGLTFPLDGEVAFERQFLLLLFRLVEGPVQEVGKGLRARVFREDVVAILVPGVQRRLNFRYLV